MSAGLRTASSPPAATGDPTASSSKSKQLRGKRMPQDSTSLSTTGPAFMRPPSQATLHRTRREAYCAPVQPLRFPRSISPPGYWRT
eukprot:scaffold232197_cov35-Prasinocladus_malaysianus.AAC.1